MSYFNSDQADYMRSLAATPREQLCQCGWYRKPECPNDHICEDGRANKERRAVSASEEPKA